MFSYLFDPTPGQSFDFYPYIIALSLLLIGGSIAFNVYYNRKKKEDLALKKLFAKTSSRLFQLGALFALLTALRYENIPYFSMRIWLYASIGILIYFAYQVAKKYRVDYPVAKLNNERKATQKAKQSRKKYSTKKKRK